MTREQKRGRWGTVGGTNGRRQICETPHRRVAGGLSVRLGTRTGRTMGAQDPAGEEAGHTEGLGGDVLKEASQTARG